MSWVSASGNKCTWRKATKEHECRECGGLIEYSDEYLEITGDSDGVFWTIRICKNCDMRAVRNKNI